MYACFIHYHADVLMKEKGVEFIVRGNPKQLCGSFAIVSADNLGSVALGRVVQH